MIKLYHNDDFYGVRTAVYRLKSKKHKSEILLFPITLFGRDEYYQELFECLKKCEFVFALFKDFNLSKKWSTGRIYNIICGVRSYGLVNFYKKVKSERLAIEWVFFNPKSNPLKKPFWLVFIYLFYMAYKCWSVIFRGRDHYRNKIVVASIRSNIYSSYNEKSRKVESFDSEGLPKFMHKYSMQVFDHTASGVSSISCQLEKLINEHDGVVGVLGVGTNIKIALMCLTELHGYTIVDTEWINESVMRPD